MSFVLLAYLALLLASPLHAQNQDNLPVRPYVNPEEMIAFDRNTPFQEAIQVLDSYSQKFRDKFLIDRTETKGPIGINLPAMHWKEALDLILNVKELALRDSGKFYEIVEPSAIQVGDGDGGVDRFRQVGEQRQQETVGDDGLVLDTNSKEVRISATFFEGSRRVLKELGIDWSTLQDGVVQVKNVGAANVSQEQFSIQLFPQNLANGIQVEALFKTFEANNVGEILATPTIKVLDGQEGEVQVGQDIPILQRDFAGNTTTQLVQVGSILTVTPQIVEVQDTTFIYMEIAAERSSGQRDPAGLVINKQNAESEILLLDGESTVIAGLYSTQESTIRRGIPILKDLPPWFFGLRYLFGFTSVDKEVRELIILIKAEVDPGIAERMDRKLKSSSEVFREERRDMSRYNESLVKGDVELTEVEYDKSDISPDTSRKTAADGPDTAIQKKPEPRAADTLKARTDRKEEEEMTIRREPYEGDVEANKTGEDSVEEKPESKETKGLTYYIVGGAFEQKLNAIDFRENLNNKGHEAEIIRNEQKGYFYVIYNNFQDSVRAKKVLEDIRQYKNKEAWLYRKANDR